MEWNGLSSLIYGFLSGFTGILPVSCDAHQRLFQILTGISGQEDGFRLACHISGFVTLLLIFRPELTRFRRERRIAAIPPRRRRRQPDQSALKEARFLRTAAIPAVMASIVCGLSRPYLQRLWVMALMLVVCGILLYFPQFFRIGNKNADHVSGLDGILVGFGNGVSTVPGVSGFAGSLCVSSLRGFDKQFAADSGLLLLIAVLPVLMGYDVFGIIAGGSAVFTVTWLVLYFLAAAAAAAGTWMAVKLVRFLAVRIGFSGFAYYCWGVAIFTFALYLMI